MPLIAYAPDKAPGTPGTNADGRAVTYVAPERFYPALLGRRMIATLVFLAARSATGLTEEQRRAVDDAIADTYWTTYGGCLTPRPVLRALSAGGLGPTGPQFVDFLDGYRAELQDAESVDDALDLHADTRIALLRAGAQRLYTDEQVAIGEFMADYLMIQRAVAFDVRRAEDEREEGQTRADLLEEWDKSAGLHFERVVGLLLQSKRIADLIPATQRAEIEAFARRRRHYYRDGVLSLFGAG